MWNLLIRGINYKVGFQMGVKGGMKAGIIHLSEGDEQTASKIAGYRSES